MTSNTFKSAPVENRTLLVEDGNDLVCLQIEDFKYRNTLGIALRSDTAPALALAILEAAWYAETDGNSCFQDHFGKAMFYLRLGTEQQERETAEAEAQAELEAEALELFNAWRKSFNLQVDDNLPLAEDWDVAPSVKTMWLAVARKAREMRAEK